MKYVYLKQKVFAIRDEYKVYDDMQNVLYEAKGKFISLNSHKDIFKGGETTPIYTIRQKILTFVPTYFLYDANQQIVAKLAQQLLAFFGVKFNLVVQGKPFKIQGDFFGYNYSISDESGMVVQIQKKFLAWGDTYQLAIEDSFDEALAVSVVLMIDDFIDDKRKQAAIGIGAASSHNQGRNR
jgi:uncharacterized protein YxjI